MYFLILPNQLFDVKYLDKSYTYIIWECPHFFTAYKYNKKKLILHRASMKYYYTYLHSKGFKVAYCEFNKPLPQGQYTLYYPINKPDILDLPKSYTIYSKHTPNLLLSPTLIETYRRKTKKFFFNAFYMWSKKQLNIIPNTKSQDKLNRQIPKNTLNINQPFDNTHLHTPTKYIKEAITYVNRHFKDNYGNTDDIIYPITHADARKWLEHFIKYKFKYFGTYQDYIDNKEPYLYHSLLSALLNIGLLNPIDIIDAIAKYKSAIPMNSYEGFIRQLFWREYQHYCYLHADFSGNYFGNSKKLGAEWYTGHTGVLPVDDSIKEAFASGYLHHIKRLMVIGNYMNLSGIQPKEGFRWFMEFSCDSYEWVMYQNVYDMVFFVSGGKTMRRPYISSSNYILKMSNYKKDAWCDKWDKMYHDFINKNKKKLIKYRYYIRV
jgi:deoxyribodipyrimidine photolyase-related protein